MRAVRLFLRARAVIKYVLRAASTLENSDGEQRAFRKFSGQNLHISLLKRNVLSQVIWLTLFNQSQQFTANCALFAAGIFEIQSFLIRRCEHITGRSLRYQTNKCCEKEGFWFINIFKKPEQRGIYSMIGKPIQIGKDSKQRKLYSVEASRI